VAAGDATADVPAGTGHLNLEASSHGPTDRHFRANAATLVHGRDGAEITSVPAPAVDRAPGRSGVTSRSSGARAATRSIAARHRSRIGRTARWWTGVIYRTRRFRPGLIT